MSNSKFFNVKQEIIIILILVLPILYLTLIFDSLPAEVATHYNINGEPDDWTSKKGLYTMFGLISGILYVLLLIIPLIDPKKQLTKMGNKFFIVKLIVAGLVSVIFLSMLYSASSGSFTNDFIPLILIIFFIGLGNYLQSVKPNYFIGIRTPWTLESTENWNATHRVASRVWMIGFGLILVLYFVADKNLFHRYFLFGLLGLVIIPGVYSFVYYLKENRSN